MLWLKRNTLLLFLNPPLNNLARHPSLWLCEKELTHLFLLTFSITVHDSEDPSSVLYFRWWWEDENYILFPRRCSTCFDAMTKRYSMYLTLHWILTFLVPFSIPSLTIPDSPSDRLLLVTELMLSETWSQWYQCVFPEHRQLMKSQLLVQLMLFLYRHKKALYFSTLNLNL